MDKPKKRGSKGEKSPFKNLLSKGRKHFASGGEKKKFPDKIRRWISTGRKRVTFEGPASPPFTWRLINYYYGGRKQWRCKVFYCKTKPSKTMQLSRLPGAPWKKDNTICRTAKPTAQANIQETIQKQEYSHCGVYLTKEKRRKKRKRKKKKNNHADQSQFFSFSNPDTSRNTKYEKHLTPSRWDGRKIKQKTEEK